MASTTSGYFLIADITGYTQYLSESELEHAQDVLTTLLELLVSRTRPPLIINRLAGDAVISYGLRDNFLRGQTFVEVIEDCYTAFRSATERMVLNNTCRCNACANIGNLDLKFFVHYGEFAIQKLRGHDELVGSDVNLIHRLLKNHVTEQTGLRAYTLYTDAAIRQLDLTDICSTMRLHSESYEHLGEVQLWLQDMHPVWERKRSAQRVEFNERKVRYTVQAEVHLTPDQVWDYLAQPEFRSVLLTSDRQTVEGKVGGRIGTESAYYCYHGDRQVSQLIIEWTPFERVVTRDRVPLPISEGFLLAEYKLTPTETGTMLSQRYALAKGPWLGQLMCYLTLPTMQKQGMKDIEDFARHIEADFAARHSMPNGATLTRDDVTRSVSESLHAHAEP